MEEDLPNRPKLLKWIPTETPHWPLVMRGKVPNMQPLYVDVSVKRAASATLHSELSSPLVPCLPSERTRSVHTKKLLFRPTCFPVTSWEIIWPNRSCAKATGPQYRKVRARITSSYARWHVTADETEELLIPDRGCGESSRHNRRVEKKKKPNCVCYLYK